MEQVIAKFSCWSAKEEPTMGYTAVHLAAVTTGSEENKSFASHTPSASLDMSISLTTPASGFFIPGQGYFLTFTKAN